MVFCSTFSLLIIIIHNHNYVLNFCCYKSFDRLAYCFGFVKSTRLVYYVLMFSRGKELILQISGFFGLTIWTFLFDVFFRWLPGKPLNLFNMDNKGPEMSVQKEKEKEGKVLTVQIIAQ